MYKWFRLQYIVFLIHVFGILNKSYFYDLGCYGVYNINLPIYILKINIKSWKTIVDSGSWICFVIFVSKRW